MKTQNAIIRTCLITLALAALGWTPAGLKAAEAGRTLKVKLNYTGAGMVDDKHQIYVILSDANPYASATLADVIGQSSPPAPAAGVAHMFARQSAAGKDKTVIFRNVGVSPVFAVAFFDKDGTSKGNLEAASHVPMGAVGNVPDKLEPIKIEPGKTVQVVLAFDDSKTTP